MGNYKCNCNCGCCCIESAYGGQRDKLVARQEGNERHERSGFANNGVRRGSTKVKKRKRQIERMRKPKALGQKARICYKSPGRSFDVLL
jgi:hypothetical protein